MQKIKFSASLIILCLILCLSVFAERDVSIENDMASDLRELGLFNGVSSTDFDLERAPTRVEVIIMLIRVLGKEEEALKGAWSHPFSDVPEWADKYIGYAYENGLTQGVSSTKFGTGNAGSSTYLTFMLRALGYSDTNGDFPWDNPYDLATNVGILPDLVNTDNFWRADIVTISYAALGARINNEDITLAEKLIEAGVFTSEALRDYYNPKKLRQIPNHTTDTSDTSSTPTTPEAPQEPSGVLNAAQIYEKCSPAVFYIEISNRNGTPVSSGSGFFIESSGVAVTNYHVIEGAASAVAVMPVTGKTYQISGVYDYDKTNDWAIIQLKSNGDTFPTLEISNEAIAGGQNIFTIGSPKGLQNSISTGVISNPGRTIDGVEYIQISAPISHGSSGGALINEYGKVIGITSAMLESGQNLNFAIPISCISGADTSALHSLSGSSSTQSGNNNNNNPGSSQNAWNSVASYVKSNGTYGDGYYYVDTLSDNNYATVMYDPSYNSISFGSIIELEKNKVYVVITSLENGTSQISISVKTLYGTEVASGSATFNSADICENYNFTVSKFDGSQSYRADFPGIMLYSALYTLASCDKLLLPSDVSIESLGFTSLYK